MCSESLYYPLVILRITYFFVFIYLRTWPVFALSFFVTHPRLYTHWWKKPGKDCGPSDFTRPFMGQSQEFGAPVLLLYESKSRTPVALIFFKYVGSSASGICPVLTQICPLFGLSFSYKFFLYIECVSDVKVVSCKCVGCYVNPTSPFLSNATTKPVVPTPEGLQIPACIVKHQLSSPDKEVEPAPSSAVQCFALVMKGLFGICAFQTFFFD